MDLLKYGIGIDVSMEKLDVCLSVINKEQHVSIKATKSFQNNINGYESIINWSKKHCKENLPLVFLMEATGVYYEQLAWFLHKEDRKVIVVLPNRAKRYKESLGLKSKNDSIDAKGLSQMCCEQNLKLWQPKSKKIYALRLITRQVERLANQITQMKNQLHSLEHGMYRDKSIEKMIGKSIALMISQKQKLENKIQETIDSDVYLKERFNQITLIKGLGVLTLATIVAETDGFALIENQSQLVSYAGYDIVENQSGKFRGKTRISKKGNNHIRRALHMPALNMVRYEQNPFVELYKRVYERSKIKMKGYTAIQKKLLIIIYTLWKNEQAYDPILKQKTKEEEKELSFVTALKKQQKKASVKTEASQDKHPSKNRSRLSFV
jgi:transposase